MVVLQLQAFVQTLPIPLHKHQLFHYLLSHPAKRCRFVHPSDVAITSQMAHPMTSWWYVFTKLYWNVLTTSQEDVTTTSYHNNVLSVGLHDVSNNSQMKHPTTSQWYVTKASQWYEVQLLRLYDVFCKSKMKHQIGSLRQGSTTSGSYVVVTPC